MAGLIQYVADNALVEAQEFEAEAGKLEAKAAELRKMAEAHRALHAIAEKHAKPTVMVNPEPTPETA